MTRGVGGSRDGRWGEQNKRKMPPHPHLPHTPTPTHKKRKLKEGWWQQLWGNVDELKNWERKRMALLAEVRVQVPGSCWILKSPKVKRSDWWHAVVSSSTFTYLTPLFLVAQLAFANCSTDLLTALHAVVWDLCCIFCPAQIHLFDLNMKRSSHQHEAVFRGVKWFDSATKQAEK